MRERKIFFTNKTTDWDFFRSTLKKSITLSVKLITSLNIELAWQNITNGIAEAA